MPPEAPAPAPDLCTVARRLREDCSLLAQSLAALRGVPPEQGQADLARRLAETRALEQRIASCVGQLNAGRARVKRLPAPQRSEAEACVAEARVSLEAAAGAYGALAADVVAALATIRQHLDGIRQGDRILRGYRQATG